MAEPSPCVLLFTNESSAEVQGYVDAARRAGVVLRVVSEQPGDHGDGEGATAIAAQFARRDEHVEALMRALEGVAVDGLLVTGARPAWLAAHVARARGLAWHAPEAVVLTTDRLLTRGRLLAADLPTPWFVGLPVSGDDDLDRLARAPMPCVVAASDTTVAADRRRADSWDGLVAARAAFAAALAPTTNAMLIVEGLVAGRGFVIDGVLEQGALRVFALFEVVDLDPAVAGHRTAVHVSPARMAPDRQHVVAGHVARAALALGLHHGPIHATCRVEGDTIVVLRVAPHPPARWLGRALPVVAPDRTRGTYEDALLAHALGRPLDHYGHQAIASGVLTLDVEGLDRGGIDGLQAVADMPWVTDVEAVAPPRTGGGRASVGGWRAVLVYAQGAQPDDVVATLEAASRQLRITPEPAGGGARH